MGNKIFVSYKYADNQVEELEGIKDTTVRDYVDLFEEKIDASDSIFKGESDGEDLSDLSDDAIWEKLKDRIYDSSVTIVFISPNMKESGLSEKNQWIPWEISYSLKETSRRNKNGDLVTSHANAMLAVVLPDREGSYEYYLKRKNCCSKGCTSHLTNILFTIMKENKFNRVKNESKRVCDNGDNIWSGTSSYIEAVKWVTFINNYQYYIEKAFERQKNIEEYEIQKEV